MESGTKQAYHKRSMFYYILLLTWTSSFLYVVCTAPETVAKNSTILDDYAARLLQEKEYGLLAMSPWKTGTPHCYCWNTTDGRDEEVECKCQGKALEEVPDNLNRSVTRIIIGDCDIKVLKSDALQPYKSTLRELVLTNMPFLETIEPGIFSGLAELQTVSIYDAMSLRRISEPVFQLYLPQLKIIRILHTGLEEVPHLSDLVTNHILTIVEFENNLIRKVFSKSIKVKTDLLLLNYNRITEVESHAFNGSEIAKLSLKGNRPLTKLHPDAFAGLRSLRELDLSETSIPSLPTKGLQELEVLHVEDVETMTVIPSIYHFEHIREAYLTYPYHCCAFQYPETHDPEQYAKYQKFLQLKEKFCLELAASSGEDLVRSKRDSDDEWFGDDFGQVYPITYSSRAHVSDDGTANSTQRHVEAAPGKRIFISLDPTDRALMEEFDPFYFEGERGFGELDHTDIDQEEDGVHHDAGVFHQDKVSDPGKTQRAACANWTSLDKNSRTVKCVPRPDAFSPCEDLMGVSWLRVSVWVVALLAGLGNAAVLIVLILGPSASSTSGGQRGLAVHKFLMANLASADLAMACYLALLATMDLRSRGHYFNFALQWQHGAGCQVAGFLTVLSSVLSVYTLAVVTGERWYAITYALHLTKRLGLRLAAKVMAVGWFIALTAATLPLLGVSGYHKTSICLPMESRDLGDRIYLASLLCYNAVAFFLVCACYAQIYSAVRGHHPSGAPRADLAVAKKMALLVFTDFACWAPVAFFGLTAVAGYPLIGVSESKILLVFFYPLNACCNPYLYAILTKQYRRDLFTLLERFGFCTQRAARYKGAYSTANTMPRNTVSSAPPHRNSLQTQTTSFENLRVATKKQSSYEASTTKPGTPPAQSPLREDVLFDPLPDDPVTTGASDLDELYLSQHHTSKLNGKDPDSCSASAKIRGSPHPVKNSYAKLHLTADQEGVLMRTLSKSDGGDEEQTESTPLMEQQKPLVTLTSSDGVDQHLRTNRERTITSETMVDDTNV